MRKLFIILAAIAALIAAMVVYLIATTPKHGEPLRFPLSDAHRAMLARVPASAESFALIPSAALLHRKLALNAVTSASLTGWEEEHEMLRPWMLGGADIVAWKSGKKTSYVVGLDPFRAILTRIWLMMASNAVARWEGSTLVMNDPAPSPPGDVTDILRLASGLPAGDAFLVQRRSARGAFPPIARPAVTSLRVTPTEILIVSRAATNDTASNPSTAGSVQARFPRGAMLSVTFSEPLRILGDLNRILGVRIDDLVAPGGSIALYDVETGTLLPRPRGVVAVTANDQTRAAMADVIQVAEVVGDSRDTGDQIQVAFDHTSLGLYSKDTFLPASWTGTTWALRIDPVRLVPILRRLSDSQGLRFLAPRIHRAVRDLRRWVDAIERAESIEAASMVTGGVEEMRVRVTSP